jgi:signal peptidase II
VTDEAPPAAPAVDRKKWILFIVVTLLSLFADQATKIWARAELPVSPANCDIPYDIMSHKCFGVAKPVIDGFWDWRLSMNPGSAFGLFAGTSFARVVLSLVGIAACVGMVFMLKKARRDQTILHWALALVAGGAVGNLVDRVYFGQVTDFVLWRYHTHEWPVFNVADVVLVVGVGLMFIDIQKENNRTKKKPTKEQKEAAKDRARAAGLVKD